MKHYYSNGAYAYKNFEGHFIYIKYDIGDQIWLARANNRSFVVKIISHDGSLWEREGVTIGDSILDSGGGVKSIDALGLPGFPKTGIVLLGVSVANKLWKKYSDFLWLGFLIAMIAWLIIKR